MTETVRLHRYTTEQRDLFENVLKDNHLLLNHVMIESGKFFPKHPTDAHVYIIVVKGELSIAIGDEDPICYQPGNIIEVGKGVESVLGNASEALTELFVIKR